MKTTLDIDDDVLAAAIELASRQRTTAGKVISRLARTALSGMTRSRSGGREEATYCDGLPVNPRPAPT